MRITTHPANKKFIEKLAEKYQTPPEPGIHQIRGMFGVDIVYDEHMEKEKPTGRWLTLKNQFFTYWDGQGEPPSWCIYFGFVKPEMEPVYYIYDETLIRRTFVFDPTIGKPRAFALNYVL